jgi:hypothetical protein
VVAAPSPKPYTSGEKGLFDATTRLAKIDPNVVKENLSNFFDSVTDMLSGVPNLVAPYKVDEIEVTFEITAEGSIQLLGGVKAGASGGLTIKLKHE